MKFSEPMGLVQPTTALQSREMDGPLRTGLWNALSLTYFTWTVTDEMSGRTYPTDELRSLVKFLWARHFDLPLDTVPQRWVFSWLGQYAVDMSFVSAA